MQKKLQGKLYERWLSILQQFNIEFQYKPAAQMVVPDALSRSKELFDPATQSPDEEDPNFPYVQEPCGQVRLPGGIDLNDLILPSNAQVNQAHIETDLVYEEDTEDLSEPYFIPQKQHPLKPKPVGKVKAAIPINVTDSFTERNDNTVDDTANSNKSGPDALQSLEETDHGGSEPMPEETMIDKQLEALELLSHNGFNTDTITKLQACDASLLPLITYLKTGILPKSQRVSRSILLKSGDYMLINDMLYHSRKAKSKRTEGQAAYQVVLPLVIQPTMIKLYHECPLAGHGGIRDTIDRLKEHYFFDKLAQKVTDFVQSCHQCQTRKITKAHTKSAIVAYPTPMDKFQVWEVDIYGELPTTNGGHKYIFTATCMFSKFLVCIPIQNKDTLTVADAFMQLISLYGYNYFYYYSSGTN